jgi:hypothetical protein
VTTDGHQVSEEGRHGSMIIQQGVFRKPTIQEWTSLYLTKHEAGGFEMGKMM